jgi:hypothetical protein
MGGDYSSELGGLGVGICAVRNEDDQHIDDPPANKGNGNRILRRDPLSSHKIRDNKNVLAVMDCWWK